MEGGIGGGGGHRGFWEQDRGFWEQECYRGFWEQGPIPANTGACSGPLGPEFFLRLLMHFRLCERAFRVAEGVKKTKKNGACGGLTVIFTKIYNYIVGRVT